jgi:hypothetical protein
MPTKMMFMVLLLVSSISAQDYSSLFRRPDMKIWEFVDYRGVERVPYDHWYDHFRATPLGTVRYDFPADLVEYGVPGCQAWDESTFDRTGPVWFDHVLKQDYILMRAPADHLISWTCHGMRRRK